VNQRGISGLSRFAWRSMTWPLEAWRPGPAAQSPLGGVSVADRLMARGHGVVDRGPGRGSHSRVPAQYRTAQTNRRSRGGRVSRSPIGRRDLWVGTAVPISTRCGWTAARIAVSQLDLRSVSWDGLIADELSVVADAVALTPPPKATLTLSGLEMQGRSALAPLVGWLDRRVTACDLRVAGGSYVSPATCSALARRLRSGRPASASSASIASR
jgi:hypothetical protein